MKKVTSFQKTSSKQRKQLDRNYKYLYSIIFEKSVYIGISIDPIERLKQHQQQFSKAGQKSLEEPFELFVSEEKYDLLNAVLQESLAIKRFKSMGYEILNKSETNHSIGKKPKR